MDKKEIRFALCGLPSVGKSRVGKELSSRLGCPLIDTDHVLEEIYAEKTKEKLPCRQIFLKQGESFFRQLENNALKRILKHKNAVVALGGGTLELSENASLLKSWGKIIYLKTDSDLLYSRLLQKGMPAYLDKENPKKSWILLAETRCKTYDKLADFIFDMENYFIDSLVNEVTIGQ